MKNNNSSNKKPKKNGRKIQLPSKAKSKKLKLKVKETALPPSNYNGGAVFTIDQVNKENDTTTASSATTYYAEVDASKQETQPEAVITSLPNKEELYSKYTEAELEEEQTSYNNSVVPKANDDGLKTMIIIAGALSLIAFLALVLS